MLRTPCPSVRARFQRGVRLGLPIFLGYLPIGMAFGILSRDLGFSALQSVVCSASALAGAGQFIALSLMKARLSVFGVVLATTIVNLRYVLFSASLSTFLRETPLPGQAALAFCVTDETFGVDVNDHREGSADAWSMAGVGAIAWLGWVLGTLIGALASGLVGDPSRFGVEYAMPAMFVALFVAQVEDRRHLVVGAVAAALTVAFAFLLPGRWPIIAAAVVAASVGAVVYR